MEEDEMTDVATPETETSTEPAEAATEAKPAREKKTPVAPKPCACSRFLLADESDPENVNEFDTDCPATTARVFAQGHDAKLVSFLVQGEFDGLLVRELRDGVRYQYDGAAHALGSISDSLGAKAEAALARLLAAREAKTALLAERQATKDAKAADKLAKAQEKAQAKLAKDEAAALAKAAAPREVGAKVVDGSQTGDTAPAIDGLIKIKVGRGEYDAQVSEVDHGEGGTKKVVTYTNLRGEEETRDLDLVRVLS